MSDENEDIVVAEGPLFLLWYSQELGGHALYAQWNGFVFDLYGDAAKTLWFGEAETLEEPDVWAWELLAFYERLPVAADDNRLAALTTRSGRG